MDTQPSGDHTTTSRRLMFKASAELGDGTSVCTFADVDQLCHAIRNFAESFSNLADEGESFSVELVVMTDEEFNQLPELW